MTDKVQAFRIVVRRRGTREKMLDTHFTGTEREAEDHAGKLWIDWDHDDRFRLYVYEANARNYFMSIG